jgi:hypothetical protein
MGVVDARYSVGLARVHRLFEQVLADWWDDEDVTKLAEETPCLAA